MVLRDIVCLLDLERCLDNRCYQALINMPFDVAMEEPLFKVSIVWLIKYRDNL